MRNMFHIIYSSGLHHFAVKSHFQVPKKKKHPDDFPMVLNPYMMCKNTVRFSTMPRPPGCRALGPKSLDAGREQRLGVGPKFCACRGSVWIHSKKNLTKTLVFWHPSVLMSNAENVVITGGKPSSEIDVDKIYFMDA